MQSDKKGRQRAFRPWPENHERLEYAQRIGVNVSEMINAILKDHMKEFLSSHAKQLRKSLDAPVP